MSGRVYFAAATILLSLSLCSAAVRAQEDPSVTRAREVARLQYQREKADRLAAEIAHTRQGVVSIYNPLKTGTGAVSMSYRWKLWNGTFSVWAQTKIADGKSLFFYKVGGIKLDIKFSSSDGGPKNYALESSQLPNDVKPTFADGKPHKFTWVEGTELELYTGRPAK